MDTKPDAEHQSGKKVLFNIIAFMAGTILLVLLVKYLMG